MFNNQFGTFTHMDPLGRRLSAATVKWLLGSLRPLSTELTPARHMAVSEIPVLNSEVSSDLLSGISPVSHSLSYLHRYGAP